ncbi:unnamed protein product [Schistocephalus solidus]|uniref:Uncharacterized protein n=1 Tax=Schistocephalus solidus TaxID=70667 RepID=A0A183SP39_SCHSO|nr:unnamed protein product [Schistocephalus solidus]
MRPPGKLNTVSLNVPAHYLHFNNELANQLVNLPFVDKDASVENCWCQLRDIIQSTVLDYIGRALCQHKDGFDDNDAAINTLLAEKDQLYKAYVDSPTAAHKTAFYRNRHLVQDAWMARKSEEIQGWTNETKSEVDAAQVCSHYNPARVTVPAQHSMDIAEHDGRTDSESCFEVSRVAAVQQMFSNR